MSVDDEIATLLALIRELRELRLRQDSTAAPAFTRVVTDLGQRVQRLLDLASRGESLDNQARAELDEVLEANPRRRGRPTRGSLRPAQREALEALRQRL